MANLRSRRCWYGPAVFSASASESNKRLQDDEIVALRSILEEKTLVYDEENRSGLLLIEPNLPNKPFKVTFCEPIHRQGKYFRKPVEETIEVEYLTPIELHFNLVPRYPVSSCPAFLITCKWLSLKELEKVCDKLESMWRSTKMEVLFSWFGFLQDELLDFLDHSSGLILYKAFRDYYSSNFNRSWRYPSKVLSDFENKEIIFFPNTCRGDYKYDQRVLLTGYESKNKLISFNEFKRKEKQDNSWVSCSICFSEVLGKESVELSCGHKSCRKCLSGYFTSLIKEGSVHQLKCPEVDCDTAASPALIRELISEELFQKYDSLLLDLAITSMDDIIYCPRPHCKAPVLPDNSSNLACCSNCDFAFCKLCKYTFHGVEACQLFRNTKERKLIIERYKEADESEKSKLEKTFGKKQIMEALESAMSEEWMDNYSKQCPKCKSGIEKSDGCNKMWCWKCNTIFCWLCLAVLSTVNPYSHFNDRKSKCHNMLFYGVESDDFDIEFIA